MATTLYQRKSTAWTALSHVAAVVAIAVASAGPAAAQSNTKLGSGALSHNTTGTNDTALGFDALFSNNTGSDNTATGASALFSNKTGVKNTATGAGALSSNTTGKDNTATGFDALLNNKDGIDNTATGIAALLDNISGFNNTATGFDALRANTSGPDNTATGVNALLNNTTGASNTAAGIDALFSNTTGGGNTAIGGNALLKSLSSDSNTAVGFNALFNSTGSSNIALGNSAGQNLTTGSNNIDIGNAGVAGEANTIRLGTNGTQNRTFIAGISGVPVMGSAVEVTSTGQLGIMPSAARFKHDIRDLAEGSRGLMKLRPVSFRYNNDPADTLQYGLVAEEVAKIYPELVSYGPDGEVLTVRYQMLSAMLLNELQKQAKEIEVQKASFEERLARLERAIAAQNGN